MTIFDKTAVEAAARALGTTDFEAGFEDGDDESRNFWRAKTALSAAVASMRERELVRDGNAYQTESTSKGWYAYDAKDLHEAVFILESRLRALRPVTTPRRTDGYGDPAKGEYNAFLADDGSGTVLD